MLALYDVYTFHHIVRKASPSLLVWTSVYEVTACAKYY